MDAAPITDKPKNPKAAAFGRRLRGEMLAAGNVGTRELGRRIARPDLTAHDARRQIMKYLKGDVLPSPERRAELAEALGLEPGHFESDDDEEDDAVLAADLLMIIRRLVQRERRRMAPLAVAFGLIVPVAAAAAYAPPMVVEDEGSLPTCRQGEYQRIETVLGTYECIGPQIGPWFWRFTPR